MGDSGAVSKKGLDLVRRPTRWLKHAMHPHANGPSGTIVPTLRYRDVAAAIDWLCSAFGFERHLVVPGEDGSVHYAQLTFGDGMIMLGPVAPSAFDGLMTQPADTGGAETQICYLFVGDAAAHCAQATAAGAEIVLDIEDADSNGRGYSCRDLEGHVWNFGTYDPWKRQPAPVAVSSRSSGLRRGLRRVAVAASLVAVVVASAVMVGWALGVTDASYLELRAAASATVAEPAGATQHDQLAQERAAREAAETVAREVQAQLAREQSARENAERAARQAGNAAGRAQAERALEDARQQLARERSALEASQRSAQEARERLSLAERASEAVQEQLAAERSARKAAELAAQQARQQLASAKEAAERAAKEAREQEARERVVRRPPPRLRQVQPVPSVGRPVTTWDPS